MRHRILIVTALVVAAGCGSTHTVSPVPTTPSEQGAASAQATASAADISAAGIPTKPDAATADAYVRDLTAIDPDIVDGKPDRVVSRGRDQCSSVKQGFTEDKLVDLVQKRFTSADHPEGFGPEKSKKILVAVRKYLCP